MELGSDAFGGRRCNRGPGSEGACLHSAHSCRNRLGSEQVAAPGDEGLHSMREWVKSEISIWLKPDGAHWP